jgi:hypothetical protein
MNTTLKRLAFATMLALSLFASTSTAFAKDSKHGRETAWTDLGPIPPMEDVLDPLGVTWEE